MTCPLLREAQVKYCRTATVRKLIPLAQSGAADEKCSSGLHRTCKVFQTQPAGPDALGPCPYLLESLMQYCAAAPVAKLVPYSESLLSRCGNDSFRYCELFLSMAHPGARPLHPETVPIPDHLRYSANHMWLDVAQDGVCHAGIDAFLARLLGSVERLTFVQQKGRRRPGAVLTVGGVDLEVTFPNPFLLTGCNLYLRANPSRVTAEPYTAGWLFEGVSSPETLENLMTGAEARHWMEQEHRRINEFLQQQQAAETGTLADGGMVAPALAHHLDRERLLELFHEFFSPYASGKRT
jgi:glycine cleavage system H lipoate-binding protein